MILSLNAPAVQAIHDVKRAIAVAREANDVLAAEIAKRPDRFAGFAALPMQDPEAAARELTRCVKDLGFIGALVNGFSQGGTADSALYYDLPQYRPFWRTVHRNGWMTAPHHYPAKKSFADYFRSNFVVTTSGNFSTSALSQSIAELGIERVLWSADYPFEAISDAAEWIDAAPLSEADRRKICRDNALTLFKLK